VERLPEQKVEEIREQVVEAALHETESVN